MGVVVGSPSKITELLVAFDGAALIRALRGAGGSAAAERLVTGRSRRADPDACLAVVRALLDQVGAPSTAVSAARLDAFVAVAGALGVQEPVRRQIVVDRLGITEGRLRAYGLLGIALDATDREIKDAHRRAAKRLHPDRLARAPADHRAEAERQLAGLNVARDVLLRREGVVLAGADDVTLEAPDFDPEDAPTVLWGDGEIRDDDLTVVVDDLSSDPDLL